jgi:hypothetical protein
LKTLYKTERTSAQAKDIGHGASRPGVAWFEMVLHDGPVDNKTWEGGGQTVAYWRENFARLRNPYPWGVEASRLEGVPAAVIPDEVVQSLPDDARISFVWHFVDRDVAARPQPPA